MKLAAKSVITCIFKMFLFQFQKKFSCCISLEMTDGLLINFMAFGNSMEERYLATAEVEKNERFVCGQFCTQ